jgi:hypothetical protein
MIDVLPGGAGRGEALHEGELRDEGRRRTSTSSVGIDLGPEDGSEPYYRMKNSWGKSWADGGTARFRLADLEKLIFEGWGDAVLIHELPEGGA